MRKLFKISNKIRKIQKLYMNMHKEFEKTLNLYKKLKVIYRFFIDTIILNLLSFYLINSMFNAMMDSLEWARGGS